MITRLPSKCLLLTLTIAGWAPAWSQVSVLTGQYDATRASANLSETFLTTSNVNTTQFGLLFTLPVDDYMYAQPLYVPQVQIAGVAHNVLYAATINNSVYAFDADSAGPPLWQGNLGPASVQNNSHDLPSCGILATPVIDLSSDTMYVIAQTEQSSKQSFSLHALDITSGAEKFGGPVTIKAIVKGTGSQSHSGVITFQAASELQRPALLLFNGTVYIGFARQNPEGTYPFHGWVLGYNAATLKQSYVLNTTPNGTEGGVWMSGRGPVADSQGFTFMTGNGDVGNSDIGESFARIGKSHSLLGLFTDPNWSTLNANDFDLGAGGPLLIPGTSLLLGGGKTGTVYLLSITSAGALQLVQTLQATPGCPSSNDASCAQIHSPAYWNRIGANPPLLYLWATNDVLKAFSFSGGLLSTSPVAQNTVLASNPGGGALAISANGSTAGTGILWATMSTTNASNTSVPGILRAFDASNVATELWNSNMNAADNLGNLAKFVVPVVVNGKVYMSTFSNQLAVYGLESASVRVAKAVHR
jgi:hypothetical protein